MDVRTYTYKQMPINLRVEEVRVVQHIREKGALDLWMESQWTDVGWIAILGIIFRISIWLAATSGDARPASAVGSLYSERSDGGTGMERDGSMNGLEAFDKLSLERGGH